MFGQSGFLRDSATALDLSSCRHFALERQPPCHANELRRPKDLSSSPNSTWRPKPRSDQCTRVHGKFLSAFVRRPCHANALNLAAEAPLGPMHLSSFRFRVHGKFLSAFVRPEVWIEDVNGNKVDEATLSKAADQIH
jgi:hypothetical protein